MKEKLCEECNEKHELIAFCEECGVCLYKNGIHLYDPEYPLEKCKKCGTVNFWD